MYDYIAFLLLFLHVAALADTTQLVESERLQLQAELERRMVLFEQNHTSSLTELETSRRALVEQLAASEATNVQLRDELAVLTQKFMAKVSDLVLWLSFSQFL